MSRHVVWTRKARTADTAVEEYMRSSEYERDIIASQSSSDDSYSEDDSEDDNYNPPYWPTASPEKLGKQTIEDLSSELQSTDVGKFEVPEIINKTKEITKHETTVEGEEEIDETGLEEKDIELVMHQSNASKLKAVKALQT